MTSSNRTTPTRLGHKPLEYADNHFEDTPLNPPTLALVVAYDRQRCIGVADRLPWHLPDDLKHFKALTLGAPILMGRKTYASIGRPLPGRLNLVLSRNAEWQAEGTTRVASLAQALALCAEQQSPRLFVIGGGEVYRLTLEAAQTVYATEVDTEVTGDTWFPALPELDWQETERIPHPLDAKHAHAFDFVTYQRKR